MDFEYSVESVEKHRHWCVQNKIPYYQVSAKDNINIDDVFTDICNYILKLKKDASQIETIKPEIIKASLVTEDVKVDEYTFICDLMEIDKIMVSVFHTNTGITYKIYINKTDDWFIKNIHIFRGDFNKVIHLLNDCFINNNKLLPYIVTDIKGGINIKINYTDTLFPFELDLDIPKYISKNGELEDKVNSLEYQVKKLTEIVLLMKNH